MRRAAMLLGAVGALLSAAIWPAVLATASSDGGTMAATEPLPFIGQFVFVPWALIALARCVRPGDRWVAGAAAAVAIVGLGVSAVAAGLLAWQFDAVNALASPLGRPNLLEGPLGFRPGRWVVILKTAMSASHALIVPVCLIVMSWLAGRAGAPLQSLGKFGVIAHGLPLAISPIGLALGAMRDSSLAELYMSSALLVGLLLTLIHAASMFAIIPAWYMALSIALLQSSRRVSDSGKGRSLGDSAGRGSDAPSPPTSNPSPPPHPPR